MASRGLDMGMGLVLVVVLVAMLWSGTNAQSCTSALTSLSPCLNYITGNMSTPSFTCCSQLRSVVQSSPQCLCSVLNSGASLGITINQTLAMQLPGACQVQTPPVSQCNGGTSGNPSAVSPSGSSGETPEGAMTPSESDIPSGTGSKSVPSMDGGSSDASISKASLVFVLFLVSVAFVTKF